jgi:hypothetical protein
MRNKVGVLLVGQKNPIVRPMRFRTLQQTLRIA